MSIFLETVDKKSKLELSGEKIIGRDDFSFDKSISRKQCQITVKGGRLYIEDLGASNTTKLNGKKLIPNKKTKLNIGDKICMGRTGFMVIGGAEIKPAYKYANSDNLNNLLNAARDTARKKLLEKKTDGPSGPTEEIAADFDKVEISSSGADDIKKIKRLRTVLMLVALMFVWILLAYFVWITIKTE